MKKLAIMNWDDLLDRQPAYAMVANVDLVVIRYDNNVSVLYGRMARLTGIAHGGVS
jgi:hypothetical protein